MPRYCQYVTDPPMAGVFGVIWRTGDRRKVQGLRRRAVGTCIKPMLAQAACTAVRVRGRLQARCNRLVRRRLMLAFGNLKKGAAPGVDDGRPDQSTCG